MKPSWLLLGPLLAACSPVDQIDWAFVQGQQSLILALGNDDGEPRLVAQAATAPPLLALDDSTPLYVVALAQTLDELMLAPGPLSPASGPRRPWPADRLAYVLRAPDREPVAISAEELNSALGEEVLPDLQLARCLENQGCFRYLEPAQSSCVVPCERFAAPEPPLPPLPPALPQVSPCPIGWSPRLLEGVTVCDAPGFQRCPVGQRQSLDSGACRPVGPACAPGPWPVDPTPGRPVYYVSTSGLPGDGSASQPFAGLADAWASVPTGSTLLLGPGRYLGSLVVDRDLALVGLCPAQTIVAATAGQPALRVVSGGRAALMGLSLETQDGAALELSGGLVEAQGLELRGGGTGVLAQGGTIQASELSVVAHSGWAFDCIDTALRLEAVSIDGGTGGLQLQGPAAAEIDGLWLEAPQGPGLSLRGTALTLNDGLIRGHRDQAVILDEAAELIAHRVSIDGQHQANGVDGAAGARFTGDQLHFLDTVSAAVRLGAEQGPPLPLRGSLTLRDLIVEGALVRGVVGAGVELTVERALLVDGSGIAFDLPASASTLRDLTVARIHELPDGDRFGSAIISDQGTFRVERARLADFDWIAVRSYSNGPRVGEAALSDVSIERARYYAIQVYAPMLSLTRVKIETAYQGVQIGSAEGPTASVLEDVQIIGTEHVGAVFYGGATQIRRMEITAPRYTGLQLAQTTAEVQDLRVEGVDVGVDARADLEGVGIAVGPKVVTGDLEFAKLDLVRFELQGSGKAGLWLGLYAETTFGEGWIEGFELGVLTNQLAFDAAERVGEVLFDRPQSKAGN